MLVGVVLLAQGVSEASFPPMCQPNSRPPTASFQLGVNYFSCGKIRHGGVKPIRAWARQAGCVDLTTGRPIDCDSCLNSWVDSGFEMGHRHDFQRTSKVFYSRGTIWSDRQPPDQLFTSTGFSFRTIWGLPKVLFLAPEAAAAVRVSAWARLRQRDKRFDCQPFNPWANHTCTDASRQEAYFDFLLDFLPPREDWAQLPASANYLRCDYFWLCRETGQDSQGNRTHPSNLWGEVGFLESLQALAVAFRNYRDDTGQQPFKHYKLMIGDISLEKGGVFDLDKNWSPPHCRHRVGRSANISRYVWDTQARGYRELTLEQRQMFIDKVCWQLKKRLSCAIHAQGTDEEHFHVEYLTVLRQRLGPNIFLDEYIMKPEDVKNMPCPWPSPLTHDDTCPVVAPLPH